MGTITWHGLHWRHSYSRWLTFPTTISTKVYRADGRIVWFKKVSGLWQPNRADIVLKLAQSGGTWTVTDADDTVETYNSSGWLTSVTARSG